MRGGTNECMPLFLIKQLGYCRLAGHVVRVTNQKYGVDEQSNLLWCFRRTELTELNELLVCFDDIGQLGLQKRRLHSTCVKVNAEQMAQDFYRDCNQTASLVLMNDIAIWSAECYRYSLVLAQ